MKLTDLRDETERLISRDYGNAQVYVYDDEGKQVKLPKGSLYVAFEGSLKKPVVTIEPRIRDVPVTVGSLASFVKP